MSTSPRISLVTPSLNQAGFLEDTLRSVLDQDYPELEYIVMDGGSSDGSADIIGRYASRLAYWRSEPDTGHYAALNEGFARSTGAIMGWLNADDLHLPWTLRMVGEVFSELPEVQWITTACPMSLRRDGQPTSSMASSPPPHREAFLRGECKAGPGKRGYLMQEGTFWRRSLWDQAGGHLDTTLTLAADFDLWARFFEHAEVITTSVPLAGFRHHGQNRSVTRGGLYEHEASSVLARYGRPAYTPWGRWWRMHLAPSLTRFPRVLRALRAWYPVKYLKPTEPDAATHWRLADRLTHF